VETQAPADREASMQWFEAQTDWSEDHDYDDASVTTPALRAWFLEMIETFPALNGLHAPEGDDVEDESSLTDYSVGQKVIYGASLGRRPSKRTRRCSNSPRSTGSACSTRAPTTARCGCPTRAGYFDTDPDAPAGKTKTG
jgi:hypothetical protein